MNFLKYIQCYRTNHYYKITFQLVGHRHQLVDHRSCSEAICAIQREYRMRHSHNVVRSSFQHKQHNGCDRLDIHC